MSKITIQSKTNRTFRENGTNRFGISFPTRRAVVLFCATENDHQHYDKVENDEVSVFSTNISQIGKHTPMKTINTILNQVKPLITSIYQLFISAGMELASFALSIFATGQ